MNHFKAIFDNNGTEYFRTFETSATKVKNFAIKSAATHLNIWKGAKTNIKEQRKHLTEFKAITEQEYREETGL